MYLSPDTQLSPSSAAAQALLTGFPFTSSEYFHAPRVNNCITVTLWQAFQFLKVVHQSCTDTAAKGETHLNSKEEEAL